MAGSAFLRVCCVLCLLVNVSALKDSNRRRSWGSSAQPGEPLKVWQSLQEPFDCQTYPTFCKAPFNCSTLSMDVAMQIMKSKGNMIAEGIAVNGPNFAAWCPNPAYASYVGECVANKDPIKAAHHLYSMTKRGELGEKASLEKDASMCFIEGFCADTRVTASTTVEEASQICDEKYGHDRWTNYGAESSNDRPGYEKGPFFTKRSETMPYAISTCAQGAYHCNVMYCKETHCKSVPMVAKYGHYSEKFTS
jgi:hypothetical protein